MALTDDLISQFVKITNDKKDVTEESTVYGTIKIKDGRTYVQLDGANDEEILTPVTEAAKAVDGERVTVLIKNHTAIVTGNLSSPSARSGDVDDLNDTIHEFDSILADKVSTDELDAERARIDSLVADNVVIKEKLEANNIDADQLQANYITVNNTLTAVQADVENLNTTKLDAEIATATYATIESLEATNADIHNLESTYGSFETLTTNNFTAFDASIKNLEANKLDANTASITYAKIADLNAINASVNTLQADLADVDTLIFGSATGTTIQTSFANSVIAQLGDTQIKSAMIESVSADKIVAGDIVTNNVRVRSEDGSLIISDETMQISDSSRVRVQIGKDASNDYSINIWDTDGKLMFSKGGITDSAIKDAIIRNDMVSDTANIAAHKLDINSLFEEINGSTNTIKSTQIYIDDQAQTLNVAFKELETEVGDLGSTVSSQGTQLSIIQGEIESRIWQQDINTATNEMSTQYSSLEQALDGFRTSVSTTYATKTEFDNLTIGGRNYFVRKNINNLAWGNQNDEYPHGKLLKNDSYRGYSFKVSEGEQWCLHRSDITNNRWGVYWFAEEPALDVPAIGSGFRADSQAANAVNHLTVPTGAIWGFIYLSNNIDEGEIPNIMLEKSTKASDWRPAPEDVDSDISKIEGRIENAETLIGQTTESIGLMATKTEVVTAKSEAIAAASADAKTKADKALTDANTNTTNLLKNYSTTSQMEAAITTRADSITSSVKNTYATKESVESIEIGGRNYFRPSNVVDLGCTGTSSDAQTLISTGSCVSFYVPTVAGEVWSLSRATTENNRFDYCFTIDEPAADVIIYNWNSTHRNDLKIEGITTPADCNYLFIYLSNQKDDMPNIKLEKGNKVTDWSPAPEDMATSDELATVQSSASLVETRVTTAESLIQQLSDSIMTLVTDSNGESLMVQNGEGWTFSTAQIQSSIENTSENLNKLTDDMGDVNTAVNALKNAVNDLGVLNDYVKIGTYENEPCIELGESDSDFKLIITNTRIMFMEGSGVPAYINNQSLHIKKAVVEEELQQGDFVWQVRSNGNLGLIWKGANS